MMMRRFVLTVGLASAAAGLSSGLLRAGTPPLEISRATIDGGGIMFSTGGDFELSGTIGQPDAGVLEGGEFELSGGFWFGVAPTDCNNDGAVNLFDHASFAECLTGPGGESLTGCECFDIDGSSAVDLEDFAVAQVLFYLP
jgi:hypothetical protein